MATRNRARPVRSVGPSTLLAFLALAAVGHAQQADRAWINGTIYTVDEAFSTASALAVRDGRFI